MAALKVEPEVDATSAAALEKVLVQDRDESTAVAELSRSPGPL